MKRRNLRALALLILPLAMKVSGLLMILQALIRIVVGGPRTRLRTMYQIKTELRTEVETLTDLKMNYKPKEGEIGASLIRSDSPFGI